MSILNSILILILFISLHSAVWLSVIKQLKSSQLFNNHVMNEITRNSYQVSYNAFIAFKNRKEPPKTNELSDKKIEKEERSVSESQTKKPAHGRSTINLYALLREGPYQEGLKEVMSNLIRNLYQDKPYYNFGLEEEIITVLESQIDISRSKQTHSNKTKIIVVEDLGKCVFPNESLQHAWYDMLKGNPSLLEYVSVEKYGQHNSQRLHIFSASQEILQALFQSDLITKKITELRTTYMQYLQDSSSTSLKNLKTYFGQELLDLYNRDIEPYYSQQIISLIDIDIEKYDGLKR